MTSNPPSFSRAFVLIVGLLAAGVLALLAWSTAVNSTHLARLEEKVASFQTDLLECRKGMADLDARLKLDQGASPTVLSQSNGQFDINKQLASRLNELTQDVSNATAVLKRIVPLEFETKEQKEARSQLAIDDLKNQLEVKIAALKSARSRLTSLAASLGITDEVAALSSADARNHPDLKPLRAYFDARDEWESAERFARTLQARLAMEEIDVAMDSPSLEPILAELERKQAAAQQQVDQLALSLQIPLEVVLRDALSALTMPSLAGWYPYFEARLERDRISGLIQVIHTRIQLNRVEQR